MRKFILSGLLAVGLFATSTLQAQLITQVTFDSGGSALYSNAARTILLTGGGATTNFDGAVLRLGYYNQGTVLNPFAGTFIPIAGSGSANTGPGYTNISIGDDFNAGAGNGTFALTLYFTAASATTGNNLPAAGQRMALQFYNGTTLANSTLYNAVTSLTFNWQAPANPTSTVSFSLDDAGLQWLGGATTANYTSQPVVPEPSTYALAAVGLLVVGMTVRRRSLTA